MPAHTLVIAPAVKADLREIYQYGLRQWGHTQSESYLENLKSHFWALTEQPIIDIERPNLFSGIRSLPIESRTLFYRVTKNTVEVIRVLHGRQDPQRHFK